MGLCQAVLHRSLHLQLYLRETVRWESRVPGPKRFRYQWSPGDQLDLDIGTCVNLHPNLKLGEKVRVGWEKPTLALMVSQLKLGSGWHHRLKRRPDHQVCSIHSARMSPVRRGRNCTFLRRYVDPVGLGDDWAAAALGM